ncbi:winged helix-turn-helix domain-containing protein [Cognatishimia sp.]|uniref:winged helix-turn-helix domain-containing protein n=1 Tax=Cognatishimia sp. TaxID=2211648 RepID=UPI003514EF59|nr:winged helix-turn-helix domain-containing protein [Cognatishimia sp.]
MQAALRISNKQARWLWLASQGLSDTPTGPLDVYGMIEQLGFVQLDTIQTVSRAHHHILWSRNQNYREKMLNPLLAKDRLIFEHFTHDASVIPMKALPAWRRQFRRMEKKANHWYTEVAGTDLMRDIKARIATEGALSTHAFDTKNDRPKEMWARPPHKRALDYMWLAGELATCFRKDFTKFYNLPERVFPEELRRREMSEDAELDWLLREAIDHIAVGTAGEIQRFWDASTSVETKDWLIKANLIPVEIENADKTITHGYGAPDIETRLEDLAAPSSRLRIVNPFDPVTRDRARLERLFGFDYRIEMFVPAAKRKWGYYVYPILEGDRFVGRIEVKANRAISELTVINFWPEPRVKWPMARQNKLHAELDRLGRFVGCKQVTWDAPFSLA